MKSIFMILALTMFISVLISCKKSEGTTSVTGMWHQTELNVYVDSGGTITHDSTYLHTFTVSDDYAQFSTDGKCSISIGHSYYIDGSGYPATPQAIAPIVSTIPYTALGTQYILSIPEPLNYGGITVGDTVSLISPNRLLIHEVVHSAFPGNYQVSDSYYQK